MTSKSSSSAASRGMDKLASIKRIAVVAAVVLLLSMAVVGSVSADGDIYTVTYDNNGATSGNAPYWQSGSSITISGNTSTPILKKSGYYFAGWNTAVDGTGDTYYPGDVVTKTLTLYAKWSDTYHDVTLPNTDHMTYSGSWYGDSTTGIYGTDLNHVPEGAMVTITSVETNSGSATHYAVTAGGWGYKDGTVRQETKSHNTYTFRMCAGNVTVTATESDAPYKVTYNSNTAEAGSVPVDSSWYATTDAVVLLENTGSLVKEGNVFFAGWSNSESGGVIYKPGESCPVSGNVTLYAQWAAEYTELEYIESTGKQWIDTGVPGNVRIESDIEFTDVDGRTLSGYYGYDGFWWGVNGGYFELSGVTTKTLQYECKADKRYTIIFDNQDSDANRQYLIVDDVTVYTRVTGGIATTQTFSLLSIHNGWNMEAKLYGCVITQGGIMIRNFVPCIYNRGQTTEKVGMYDTVNCMFYANAGSGEFNAGYFTVTYDKNSGTGDVPTDSNVYMSYDQVTVLGNTGSPALTKNGYTFTGWNTNADGSGTTYQKTNTFTILNDTTLYAKWDYSVTYDDNDATGGTAPSAQTSCYGQKVQVETSGDLEKGSAMFVGWMIGSTSSSSILYPGDLYEPQEGNVTLYAKWASPSYTFTIPASVPLSQTVGEPVGGSDCMVTISSDQSVSGKTLRVMVSSEAGEDSGKNTLFSLSGTGGNATYKVARNDTGAYIEGSNPSVTYGNEVVRLDISPGSGDGTKYGEEGVIKSQQLSFETVSYDGAGSYSGVLNFAFEITTKVTGITISGPTLVKPGKSITLTANVLPTDADYQKVTWSSSNTSVAAITPSEDTKTCVVTGVSEGIVTITATANDGSGVKGTYVVTVSILPNGYKKLEYIESTGTQYIEPGVMGNMSLECDIEFPDVNTRFLMGYDVWKRTSWGVNYNYFELGGSTPETSENACIANHRYTIIFDYGNSEAGYQKLIVDNVTVNYTETANVEDESCSLMSIHGGFGMKAKLYRCVMTQGESIVRNFVPCIDSTGTAGLYDLLNDSFYINYYSGAFKYGSKVTYEANGGTGTAPAEQIITSDEISEVIADKGNLSKDGYTFKGWNTNSEGTGTPCSAGDTYYASNGNVTLYAQWTQNP